VIEAVRQRNLVAPTPYRLRSSEQIATFFENLTLIEPGIVSCPQWRPDSLDIGSVKMMDEFCALGRKCNATQLVRSRGSQACRFRRASR
jgi:S-adenosyl methyltransferase